MPAYLVLLSLGNLLIVTGAFSLTGILEPVATAMGASVPAVGQTMTAYALATALLAPLLLVLTGRWSRRNALLAALAVFASGLLVCASAQSLGGLIVGRILMGAGGVFTPIAAGIAVASVAPQRQGKALALTFLGMSMSYVIGLPLATWIGFAFGWRAPLFGLAAIVVAMLGVVLIELPRKLDAPGASFNGLTVALRNPEAVRSLALTLLYFSAIFSVFAYTGPVLQALNPMGAGRLSATLVIFGFAGVAGTLIGGWANDRFGPMPTLRLQLAILAGMMLLVPLTAGHYALMVLVFVVWGMAGFGMMTPIQTRLARVSSRQAPLLFSLNTSMLYLGTAGGAAIGGVAGAVVGFAALAWVGALFAVLGGVTLVGHKTRP